MEKQEEFQDKRELEEKLKEAQKALEERDKPFRELEKLLLAQEEELSRLRDLNQQVAPGEPIKQKDEIPRLKYDLQNQPGVPREPIKQPVKTHPRIICYRCFTPRERRVVICPRCGEKENLSNLYSIGYILMVMILGPTLLLGFFLSFGFLKNLSHITFEKNLTRQEVVQFLKTLGQAQGKFKLQFSRYAKNLKELREQGLIDRTLTSGRVANYIFCIKTQEPGGFELFALQAKDVHSDRPPLSDKAFHYYMNHKGKITFSPGSFFPQEDSSPLE